MEGDFTIEPVQLSDYRFEAHFDNAAVPALLTDEQAPLGSDAGPNPAAMPAIAFASVALRLICISA